MSLKNFLTSKAFLKQIIIAVVITVLLVIAVMKWLNYYTNHDQKIPVPDLTKQTVDKAEKELEALMLNYVILDTVDYRPDFPPYSIVQQDPLPKVNVKENRKIYIKLNAGGYNDIDLPELVQKTKRSAESILKSVGLEVGEITYKPYLAEDVVLEVRQKGKRLSAGDKVKKASKVDLVLGDGKTGYHISDEDRANMP
ncbi:MULTISPECIES: PASTA domain-containing protein [Flavobacterium]|uniref:Membrane protein n=2 Tax=Flavobacterium TaxID=237 RepID=A0A0A2LFV4_9FLAO|nr:MULTISPECIES: PASTA domain-containing protein [Flavobacterium]KGO79047.1 membrane protein [Flavobacterium beibuense F44-8]MEE1899757.1 PASTA domain-containing protein [Flavobacterium rakeshii]MUV03455.1 PASTA domain-containing protein [Flavobacterium rakeshii]